MSVVRTQARGVYEHDVVVYSESHRLSQRFFMTEFRL